MTIGDAIREWLYGLRDDLFRFRDGLFRAQGVTTWRGLLVRTVSTMAVALSVVAILQVGIAVYQIARGTSSSLQEAIVAELVGSLVGTLLGLVTAVSLWMWQGSKERAHQERTDNARRTQVLEVIRDELRADLGRVAGRHGAVPSERTVRLPILSTEAWRAISGSGELGYIREPSTLAVVARAYHLIGQIEAVELEVLRGTPAWGDTRATALYELDNLVVPAIEEALAALQPAAEAGR